MLAADICDCWAWTLRSEAADADETAASEVAATEACDWSEMTLCIDTDEIEAIEASEREAWTLRTDAAEAAEIEATDACD